jgi:serine protease Do
LLIWNSVLTYEVFFNAQADTTVNPDGTVVQTVVTEFDTDVTRIVEDSIEKVVGIQAIEFEEVVSTGSGAIFDSKDGVVHIITNNHVVENASTIRAVFANGEELEATLIGSDVFTDLALLEVKVDFEVNAFKLGDSSLVKVGENALAIGSPLGLSFQGSVTMGIISGKDRVVPVDLDNNGTDDWDSIVLQTDAAINPGNSGGPLINLAGELIGITSMKIADSSVEGMGFAIPINEIIPIIQQLKDNGEVIRPVVGISAVSLDELAVYQKSYYGIRLDLNAGLYVMSVIKGSPAELSGIKEGDVITAFDNTNITSFKEFRKLLYTKNVGDVVTISYERAGKSTTVNVVLQ